MSRYPVCKYEILRIANQFKEYFVCKPQLDKITGKPKAKLYYKDDGFSITLEFYNCLDKTHFEIRNRIVEEYESRFPRVEVNSKQEEVSFAKSYVIRYYDELRVYYIDVEDYVQEKLKGIKIE